MEGHEIIKSIIFLIILIITCVWLGKKSEEWSKGEIENDME